MAFPTEADFGELIARLAGALAKQRLSFMLIGGQAVLLHGEPRLTQDIDVSLAASIDRLDDVLAACSEADLSPLPANVRSFVEETFVLPAADAGTGVRVDLIFSNTEYESAAIARAISIEIGGSHVPIASAEDLLLLKLFAGRPRDIEDAEGVVRRNRDGLDWSYIRRWAREFSAVPGREDVPEQVSRLEASDDFERPR
jgi:predicted nucleotidyltransferase